MDVIVINAFVDEMVKIANAAAAAAAPQAGFLRRNIKPLGFMALGAGAHSVGQDVVNDWRTGRMIRKQNEATM